MERNKISRKTLVPLNDCYLLEPEPAKTYEEQMGFTHIVLPDKFKYGPVDPPIWARVLAKGPLCKLLLRRGERVLYGKFSGAKFNRDGKEFTIVRECELLAYDAT